MIIGAGDINKPDIDVDYLAEIGERARAESERTKSALESRYLSGIADCIDYILSPRKNVGDLIPPIPMNPVQR